MRRGAGAGAGAGGGSGGGGGGRGGGPLRPEEARSSPAEWDYMKHDITWGWLWFMVCGANRKKTSTTAPTSSTKGNKKV